jgi:hypothetical protein
MGMPFNGDKSRLLLELSILKVSLLLKITKVKSSLGQASLSF